MTLTRDYYLYLCQDFIDVASLMEKSNLILDLRHSLNKILIKLFDINPHDLQLHHLTEIFLQHFD